MRFVGLYFIFIIALLIGAVSCNQDTPTPDEAEQVIIRDYLDSMSIDAASDENGIFRYLIAPNTDPDLNNTGDVYSIQYELYELGGSLIDSVTDNTQDTLVVLRHGAGAVYPPGIDMALSYMSAGEKRGFIIPSRLAYDKLSLTGIPDQMILHAIIKLVEVRTQEVVEAEEQAIIAQYSADYLEDGNTPVRTLPQGLNMRMKTTRQGVSGTAVVADDTVAISYIMRNLGGGQIDAVGEANPFTFIVNSNPGVILGINEAVKEMGLNARATLVLPSRAAYHYSAAVIPGYLIDPAVVGIEDNPLIIENILPAYTARVSPYQIILVELELISIN